MAKQSLASRLIRNFKRVVSSKGANWQFPQKVIDLLYADRSKMTPHEKSVQTKTLQRYAKDRYKQLYRETRVQVDNVEYTPSEYRKVPKEVRQEIEADYGRPSKPSTRKESKPRTRQHGTQFPQEAPQTYDYGGAPTEMDAMIDVIEDFLSKIQQPPAQTFEGRSGHIQKRWERLIEASEKSQNALVGMVQEAMSMNPEGLASSLSRNWGRIDELVADVLYGSTSERINSGYSVLMEIIRGGLDEDERELVGEYEDYNSEY